MIKHLFTYLFIACLSFSAYAQCPKFYDKDGNLSSSPVYVNCDKASFAVNIRPDVTTGSYTITWGDGSPNATGSSIAANDFVAHSYPTTIGTYTITLNFNNGACVTTAQVINQEPANASIQVPAGGITRVCAPGDMQFTNESTGNSPSTIYNWSFGDGKTLGPLQGDASYGKTITHTYEPNTVTCQTAVTLTAQNECNITPSINNFSPVQIWDTDLPSITPSTRVQCWPNNQFTFLNSTLRNCATPEQGNTGQRFEKWVFKDRLGPGQDSIVDWAPWPPTIPKTLRYPAIGDYTVELHVRNTCGETQTSITVSIIDPPTVGITSSKDTVCIGEPVTFINTGSGGSVHLFDAGDTSDIATYDGDSVIYTYGEAGNYTATLFVDEGSGAQGCASSASTQVVVLPAPQPSFTIDKVKACNSIKAYVKNTSTNGVSYTWDYGDGRTSTNYDIDSVEYNSPGKYPLKLSIFNTRGCEGFQVDTVYVFSDPIVQFDIKDTCSTFGLELDNTSTIDVNDTLQGYEWNFGDGNTSTDSLPSYAYINNGTFNVTLTVKGNNCQATGQQQVIIYPKPSASFSIQNTIVCDNKEVIFVNSSSNADSYSWDYGNGLTSNNSAPKHSVLYYQQNTVAETVSVQLIAANSLIGCPDTMDFSIEVKPEIIADFDPLPDACSPYNVYVLSKSFGIASLVWDFSGDQGANTPVDTYNYINNGINPSAEYVELRVFRVDGCSDTLRHNFTVFPKPAPDFVPSPQSQQFPATSVSFSNTTAGTWQYKWGFGDGSAPVNTSSPTYAYSTWGEYDVSLIALNSTTTCTDTIRKKVEITPPKPIPNFSINASGCRPFTVNFTESSTYVDEYQWNFGDGATSNEQSPSHTYYELGTFDVTLTVTGYGGDVVSLTRTDAITVNRVSEAFFTVSPSSIANIDVPVDMLNLSQFATSYEWRFSDGGTSFEAEPTYFFNEPGSFDITLIANNVQNCPDTMTIFNAVSVGEGGYVIFPNAFTPNPDVPADEYYIPRDISNDVFRPEFDKVTVFKMEVFTRWGERIFLTNDVNRGWNGWHNGNICQQEVYIYKAEATFEDGRVKRYVGDITLLR